MANLNNILSWFETGKKPTQTQFWTSWQSFWHKDEPIPQSSIQNLTEVLDSKAEASHLEAHYNDPRAHDLDEKLAGKSNVGHLHQQREIEGLPEKIEVIETEINGVTNTINGLVNNVSDLDQNKQILKTANFTIDNSMHKTTIFCQASGTINVSIPNGLRRDFICLLYNIGTGNVLPVLAGTGQQFITVDSAILLEANKHGIIEQLLGQNKFIVRGEYS